MKFGAECTFFSWLYLSRKNQSYSFLEFSMHKFHTLEHDSRKRKRKMEPHQEPKMTFKRRKIKYLQLNLSRKMKIPAKIHKFIYELRFSISISLFLLSRLRGSSRGIFELGILPKPWGWIFFMNRTSEEFEEMTLKD